MAVLDREAEIVQNAALGAGIIWRLAFGYHKAHRTKDYLPLPLAFLPLPLLYHHETFNTLQGTRRSSGLRAFAEKFSAAKESKSDVLLAVHERALQWRGLSWDSTRIAVETRLVSLQAETASVVPLSASKVRGVPALVQTYLKNAEKLGEWFAELSLYEVGSVLRIVF